MTPTDPKTLLAKVRDLQRLEERALPGPWTTDDGNVFSEPLRSKREEDIMRRLEGGKEPHPDGEYPLGFVCKVPQSYEFTWELIAALRNLAPELLSELERRLVAELDPLVVMRDLTDEERRML